MLEGQLGGMVCAIPLWQPVGACYVLRDLRARGSERVKCYVLSVLSGDFAEVLRASMCV